MLYVVIGFILLLVLGISYGAWMRKRAYNDIDHTEERRMGIINRPVAQELAKLKKLKMAGETEKKFDNWRNEWDKIVTSELPDIEEKLFACENLADKYHFKQAAKQIKELHSRMDKIDQQIDGILSELNAVVDSATKNQAEVQSIKENYHQVKKVMITRRNDFGQALPHLEQEVGEIDEAYRKYGSETDNGNYIEARNQLVKVKKGLEVVDVQIGQIPELYEQIKKKKPGQMKELRAEKDKMEQEKFSLVHLGIEAQLEEFDKQLHTLLVSVGRIELKEVSEALGNMQEQLDWLFAQLEKERISRSQLEQVAPEMEKKFQQVGDRIQSMAEETESVKSSYHLDSEDLKTQRTICKGFEELEKDFLETDDSFKNSDQSFSLILEKLQKIHDAMDQVETSAREFDKKIKALRKDEIAAREAVRQLKHTLFETRRIIRQSNLPGVSETFKDALSRSGGFLQAVGEKLNETPLNMTEVRQTLSRAQRAIEEVRSQADKMVETASFAEDMIRYGNRYRSESSEIDRELQEAENLFRNFDYEAAAETAVRAVERKEPKILKRTNLYKESQV